ncbi:LysR family transcriptional regulator [Modestobacter sp. SSW1-42]|uniref:LysR family transcriptional regulator n=1 Tax=Modestobacter sp. SSW1-42 TaxID=596372 RepID=UPI003986914D
MDLRHLRCFVAVVEEGSFTRAAARLGVSQPSVSTAISDLEAELATRLVDRSTPPARPTASGLVLLEHATGVLGAVDELCTAVGRARTHPSGLRVGLFGGGAGPRTPQLLQLLGTLSGREVQVSMVRTDERVPALADGTVDVVITTGPIEDPRVRVTPLFNVPRVAVVGRRHRLASARTVSVRDLLDQPFLGETVTGTGAWADYWNLVPERGGRQPRRWPTIATTDPQAFVHQHALGHTVGVAPAYITKCLPAESVGVRYIPVPDLSPASVVALTRADQDTDLLAAVQATASRLPIDTLPRGKEHGTGSTSRHCQESAGAHTSSGS